VARADKKRRGGFMFGLFAGAMAGLLLAPKSGRETREQLVAQLGIGEQVERVRGAIGAGKDSAADQSDALKHKIEETRERLRSQLSVDAQPAGDAAAGVASAPDPTATGQPS
jgi:gas vesicle protein